MVEPTPSSVTYQWNTAGCYTNSRFTSGSPQCFPHGQTSPSVTGNDLLAEDAGTITCTVTISGRDYTSEPFTLRISGERLVYCIIACIVYCKQCMRLLLATCYCCIIHQLLWFMYRSSFTVGVAVTEVIYNTDGTLSSEDLISANALTDYSYVNARDDDPYGGRIARCLTGLGPTRTGNQANGRLGGLYFNGNMIPNSGGSCSTDVIQVRPGGAIAGVINMYQCEAFSTSVEGIYTCTMMNSSMMDQSVRFGVYFTGRSELIDLYTYPITEPSFISLLSCSSDRHSIIIYCKSCCWFFLHIILYLTRFSPRHIHMEEG